jgi:solute carrier family 66 (lysosomal lysine-arginine transporter), member 1
LSTKEQFIFACENIYFLEKMSICQVSADGLAAVKWIQNIFHECAYTQQDVAAVTLGYISISFWVLAQFPQLLKNASSGTSESLSLLFLANWLSGDFANLIGCVLTRQQPFQTYLAMYFVLIDTSLFVQSLYFQQNKNATEEVVVEDIDEETPLLSANQTNLGMFSAAFLFILSYTSSAPVWGQFMTVSLTPHPTETNSYLLGRFFAWLCTFLYLTSRMPQIYWNFKRKSCNGLAMVMFFFALMGNLFTTAAILVKSTSTAHISNSVPYILGSGGTVIFDVVIFSQWVYYGEDKGSRNIDSIIYLLKQGS